MVDNNRPRRGTMAVRPRKRSSTQNVRMYWQSHPEKRLLGFAGYKVGMTTVSYIDTSEAPTKGQEIVTGATVIEVPPIHVYGFRCYNGSSMGDVLTKDEKILKLLNVKKVENKEIDETKVEDVRLLVFTQPRKTLIGKKHVERMELAMGGKDAKEKLEYAKSLFEKEVLASEAFKPGEYVDVASVTKGKGWQGAVKRFGVSVQRRKATGKYRHVGTLGQWHPAYVLYTVPQAGQTGYHKRTELNKQILKIGTNVEEVNPKDGFPHYGFVKNNYILIKGSIPGPTKRLIKLRLSVRKKVVVKDPNLGYISNLTKR